AGIDIYPWLNFHTTTFITPASRQHRSRHYMVRSFDLLSAGLRVHRTFHVLNMKKCLPEETLVISLGEIQIDDKLHFVEEPVEIIDREAEAVNIACYVQNKVLVVKPHNKTPYELFHGRTPTLSFMRPFGCPVTILNTIYHLGKFDGKADKGFFVSYSLNSKAFRVFNSRTRIVEENLHIRFSAQSSGFAGIKASDNAGQARKETEHVKDYILLPLWTTDPLFSQDPKSSHDDGSKPSSSDGKKVDEDPRKENECNDQEKEDNVNITNNVNTVGLTVNVVGTNEDNEIPFDPNMPALEDVIIFNLLSDDKDDGTWAYMNNLDITIQVFRSKNDEMGIVIRNKARLVAQGYTQEEGIDYDEFSTSVARIEAIRLFLPYASFKDFVVYQMDIKSAFLYRKIEEEVYVCQPQGFEDPDFFDRVYKKKDGIFISQDKYVAEILKKFRFIEVKNASTPMETQKPLLTDEDGKEVDVHIYRLMISSLMYLTSSRPDIMFAVCACARYQVNPKVSHLYAMKRIFRAATIASSLEAKQDSGNINKTQSKATPNESSSQGTNLGGGPRCQETIRDTTTQTRFESVSKHSIDSLLARDDLGGEEVFVAWKNENVVAEIVDAAQVKGIVFREPGKSTTTIISSQQSQDNGKGIMIEEHVKPKKKDQIRLDKEAALKAFKRVNTFEDFRKELVKRKEKRAREELEQEITKKQKVEDDKEKAELKQLMETIPDEEKLAIDAIHLGIKSPRIVDWKIHKERKRSYYQIVRADGKSHIYMIFSQMLTSFDREDLKELYKLTDEELIKKKVKQIELDDQAIQTILLGPPEDICVAVDSYETAQEIWLRVQQMIKGLDIEIQEKKAKLFNEWERFTSTDEESVES
nr:retrovirus-related Pol polyprotein from transposon TNT 1-94 [Tanacetum cinerariifolium]